MNGYGKIEGGGLLETNERVEAEGFDVDLCDRLFDDGDDSEITDNYDALEVASNTNGEQGEMQSDIDLEKIYVNAETEYIESAFDGVDIYANPERLTECLQPFVEAKWAEMSMEEKKAAIEGLYDYISSVIELKNPPEVTFYYNERYGDYGGYSLAGNELRINEYMLDDPKEAVDTVAHELWHTHQYECAASPSCDRDFYYLFNFQNYITAQEDYACYRNQLVEAEASAFGEKFKQAFEAMT